MGQYILRFKGTNEETKEQDIENIRSFKQVTIIEATDRLVLAKMPDTIRIKLQQLLSNWSIHPTSIVKKPDTRKKISR